MNIDFHTHGKLSKKVNFSMEYFLEMVKEAKRIGLNAIALTEHFNTHRFCDVYDTLDKEFPYLHGYYDVNGLKVFPGIEVDIKETGHILFVGERKDILELSNKLKFHTEKNNFIEFKELLKITTEYNFLKIGAHPFRESTPLHHIETDLLRKLDAFDLNGKDLNEQGITVNSEKVYAFADMLGLPVIGGSDTHQYQQYGCIVNNLDVDCNTVDEIKQLISEGRYQIDISPDLKIKVEAAIKMKKLLKERLEKLV